MGNHLYKKDRHYGRLQMHQEIDWKSVSLSRMRLGGGHEYSEIGRTRPMARGQKSRQSHDDRPGPSFNNFCKRSGRRWASPPNRASTCSKVSRLGNSSSSSNIARSGVDSVKGQSHWPQVNSVMSPPRKLVTSRASPLSTFRLTLLTPSVIGSFLKSRRSL